jgi:hypothetical protein
MSLKSILVVSAALLLVVLSESVSLAQRPLRRYQPPAGPTITPYLNYYRADISGLPSPYESFIVPQQQLQRNLYDMTRNQQADFRKVENAIKQVRASAAAPTGVGASFQNYSHYYRNAPGGGNQR